VAPIHPSADANIANSVVRRRMAGPVGRLIMFLMLHLAGRNTTMTFRILKIESLLLRVNPQSIKAEGFTVTFHNTGRPKKSIYLIYLRYLNLLD
jgi:hypothetical protein